MMGTRSRLLATCAAIGLAGCAQQPSQPAADEMALGRQQLVQAFDAAWVRVVASGQDREILKRLPVESPGAAASYMVSLVDCLPIPELTPFPEQPVGLFKEILERGTIRRGTQIVPTTPANTAYYFSPVSQAYQDAIFAEIEKHYGVKLEVIDVGIPPGPAPTTALLVDGKADFIDQINATGGETQDLRRRISRRFTCTISASTQYIHMPFDSPLAKEINTFDDLRARPDVRLCAGPLSTQTFNAFLPNHKVSTKYINDITGCVKDIENGKSDVIINPLPNLGIAGVKGYKSVHTLLVAGTPFWVALEGVACTDDGNPRTEDPCYFIADGPPAGKGE